MIVAVQPALPNWIRPMACGALGFGSGGFGGGGGSGGFGGGKSGKSCGFVGG
jgi:hypothetical protein